MAPNLSEEEQIIVIYFLVPTLLKGLHICYVHTALIDMHYKNIEEMKPKQSVSTKWSQKSFSTLYFFHSVF